LPLIKPPLTPDQRDIDPDFHSYGSFNQETNSEEARQESCAKEGRGEEGFCREETGGDPESEAGQGQNRAQTGQEGHFRAAGQIEQSERVACPLSERTREAGRQK
jgi:hypothetical protein